MSIWGFVIDLLLSRSRGSPFETNKTRDKVPKASLLIKEREKSLHSASAAPSQDTQPKCACALSFPQASWRSPFGGTISSSKLSPSESFACGGTSVATKKVAAVVHAAPELGPMHAHSMDPLAILPRVSSASERETIITPYDADVFEETLCRLNLLE